VTSFQRLKSALGLAALLAAFGLAGCSGSVSAPTSPPVNSATITILPATATMYSGLPTTFVLSGGTGFYIVTSSDQAILPIAGGVNGGSVTLVPNPVTADTAITLTVRDTGSAAPVQATVTVKPGTVNNNVTVTPNILQSASCNPALCSGGDADVRVTLSQGGIPLAARGVRFEVIQGDYRFITSLPGASVETTALVQDVATDQSGIARARIRATALAPNQTALLQVTDLASGAFQRTVFSIAQFTGNTPAFFTVPSSLTFTGPADNTCASSAQANVSIFGGSPPYQVAGGSSGFTVTPTVVGTNGGTFQIFLASTPQCLTNFPIAVTDATGRTITMLLSNQAGSGSLPPTAVRAEPATLSLLCGAGGTPNSATVVIVGGTGTFAASSNHPRVSANAVQRVVTIRREIADGAVVYPTSALVTVTDGNSSAVVTVTVPANCP
jgi:hypothetical protein